MSDVKFKTMRHIEAVRNYLVAVVNELLARSILHDQTKLNSPEVEVYEEFTPKLRDLTYGSEEYKKCIEEMGDAVKHHHAYNRHHPEYFTNGFLGMNLLDIIEMLCDWKAASLRTKDGDIYKSIEINQKKLGYSDEVKVLLVNTMMYIDMMGVWHRAKES